MERSSYIELRTFLLQEVKRFANDARKIRGVYRIALVGSLMTDKPNPKDADLLVTNDAQIDIAALCRLARRLKGRGQSRNSGADIFLCNSEGKYLGRTCSWKECHPRVACRGSNCGKGGRICNDLDVVRLDSRIIVEPPLEIWPTMVARRQVPMDVQKELLDDSVAA